MTLSPESPYFAFRCASVRKRRSRSSIWDMPMIAFNSSNDTSAEGKPAPVVSAR